MYLFLLLLFCLVGKPAISNSQFPTQHTQSSPTTIEKNKGTFIYWQKGKTLKWENFKGQMDHSDVVHGAVTFAGIDLKVAKIHPWSGEITFEASGIFDMDLSWVKPGTMDAQLLAHEQLHFDIAEVFARKLQAKLNSLRLTHKDSKKIKSLQQTYTHKQLELQKKYDEETLHGLRTEKQKAWRHAIDQQLLNPAKYALNVKRP